MSSHKNVNRAVALKYNQEKNTAPVIVASGNGYVASKVVEIAEENGVPVYKDDSLAVMLSQLELGSEIPENLFKSIVDIYVYFLNYNKNDTKGEIINE
ncbi:EscU/YscU/HrcU family type III secretion system export apparatus switch protein [Sedimentibacter sp. zth1]|uniref:EscU/YscU/HrcU family type III secretion system export apparatus switch protein n=1 Tax=Sedimentibacter sp. zth1 TaxID=2816908 RepID=UPI001A936716|nr:EscU/YscU/HrcU family type III secretion system export apparatus switch protein [Sedimentibacter sp. zth1]QSX07173.1 EscU/YscU/HrcU family type III secretion system export apparatus switch protein [Sedimentibacter sp. zth1]